LDRQKTDKNPVNNPHTKDRRTHRKK